MTARLHTCYSPVRRSPAESASTLPAAPRLACVKPVASDPPEPGSNSSLLLILFLFLSKNLTRQVLCFYCLLRRRTLRCARRLRSGCVLPGSLIELSVEIDLSRPLSSQPRRAARTSSALVLLSVYCNRFNVLFMAASGFAFPESECKVTPQNPPAQIFSRL